MRKTKFSLALLCLLVFADRLTAQEKLVVGVSPFTFSKTQVTEAEAEEVFREVSGAIASSGRFDVVPRDKWSLIVQERELQKGEAFIDGKTVQQGISLGAQVLFMGHVVTIDRDNKLNLPNPVFHLCAVDVATGKVLSSEIISKTQRSQFTMSDMASMVDENSYLMYNDYQGYKTARKISTVLNLVEMTKLRSKDAIAKQVADYLDDYHPLKLKIFRFQETDGEKVKTFQIRASEAMLNKGQGLVIKETKKETGLDGSTAIVEIEVAQAKVDKFEGELATCKVTKDGDKLFTKLNDTKNVFVTTKK